MAMIQVIARCQLSKNTSAHSALTANLDFSSTLNSLLFVLLNYSVFLSVFYRKDLLYSLVQMFLFKATYHVTYHPKFLDLINYNLPS